MQYRSKDKTYMQELKTKLYRVEQKTNNDAVPAWEYIRKHIVVNDLLDFIRNDVQNTNVVCYKHNSSLVDVPMLIVTATEHPQEIAIVDAFIKASGINECYRTSYSKSSSSKIIELDSLTSALKSEIKLINAKNVLIFGPHIGKLVTGSEPTLHEVCDSNMMVTSSLIQVIKSDKKTANHIKNIMWQDFKKLTAKE